MSDCLVRYINIIILLSVVFIWLDCSYQDDVEWLVACIIGRLVFDVTWYKMVLTPTHSPLSMRGVSSWSSVQFLPPCFEVVSAAAAIQLTAAYFAYIFPLLESSERTIVKEWMLRSNWSKLQKAATSKKWRNSFQRELCLLRTRWERIAPGAKCRYLFPLFSSPFQFGNTALHEACWTGNNDIVKILLKASCFVDSVNGAGFTPLHLASQNGHAKVAKTLLKWKADPTIKNQVIHPYISLHSGK